MIEHVEDVVDALQAYEEAYQDLERWREDMRQAGYGDGVSPASEHLYANYYHKLARALDFAQALLFEESYIDRTYGTLKDVLKDES